MNISKFRGNSSESRRISLIVWAAAALASGILSAPAAGSPDNWTGNSSSTWATSGNWSAGAPANDLVTNDAVFDQATYGNQPNVGTGTIQIAGLVFGDTLGTLTGNTTIGAGAGGALSVGADGVTLYAGSGDVGGVGNGAITFTAPILLGATQTWTNNSNSFVTVGALSNNAGGSYTLTLKGANAGSTDFNGIISNSSITSTTGLVINTSGGLVLIDGGGANTFTGGVTLSSGTLLLNKASALGGATGTFTINGGTFDNESATTSSSYATVSNNTPLALGGSFTFGSLTSLLANQSQSLNLGTGAVSVANSAITANVIENTLTLGGNMTAAGSSTALTKAGNGILTLSGNLALTSNSTIGAVTGGTLNANGVISGAFNLTKTGVGTMVLGNSANTYTGVTTISGGILSVGTLANANTVGGSSLGTGTLNPVNSITLDGGELLMTGTSGTNRNITITSNGGTIGDTSANSSQNTTFSGTLTDSAAASSGTQTLNLTGTGVSINNSGVIQGAIFNPSSLAYSYTGNVLNLTKSGPGAWGLGTSITYGTVSLSGGYIEINNSSALGGTGPINVTNNAGVQWGSTSQDLSASNRLALTGNLTIAMTGVNQTFAGNISGTGGLAVTSLSLTGGNTLTLNGNNTYSGGTIIASMYGRRTTIALGNSGTNLGSNATGNNVTIDPSSYLSIGSSNTVGSNQQIVLNTGVGLLAPGDANGTNYNSSAFGAGPFLAELYLGGNYALPTISSLSLGNSLIVLSSTTGETQSNILTAGNGLQFLGTNTTGSFIGATLTAGTGNVYRLGGGTGSLTINSGLLTDTVVSGTHTSLQIGSGYNFSGGNTSGYTQDSGQVTLLGSNSYAGGTTVGTLNDGVFLGTTGSGGYVLNINSGGANTPLGTGTVTVYGTLEASGNTNVGTFANAAGTGNNNVINLVGPSSVLEFANGSAFNSRWGTSAALALPNAKLIDIGSTGVASNQLMGGLTFTGVSTVAITRGSASLAAEVNPSSLTRGAFTPTGASAIPGILLLAPANTGDLGTLENFATSGTAPTITTTSGSHTIAPTYFADSTNKTFVTYGAPSTTGFSDIVYDGATLAGANSATTTIDQSTTGTLALAGGANVYALRTEGTLGSSAFGTQNTVQVNGGAVIFNNASAGVNQDLNLNFNNGSATPGIMYNFAAGNAAFGIDSVINASSLILTSSPGSGAFTFGSSSITTAASGTLTNTIVLATGAGTSLALGESVSGTGVAANTTITGISGGTITLSNALTGTLTNANVTFGGLTPTTYTGAVTVDNSSLALGNTAALGAGSTVTLRNASLTFADGLTNSLNLNYNNISTITMIDQGEVSENVANNGITRSTNANVILDSSTAGAGVEANFFVNSDQGSALVFNGNLTLNDNALIQVLDNFAESGGAAGFTSFGGLGTSSDTLTKQGTGKLVINGANNSGSQNFTGAVNVLQGSLEVTNVNSLGASGTMPTVASGAVFEIGVANYGTSGVGEAVGSAERWDVANARGLAASGGAYTLQSGVTLQLNNINVNPSSGTSTLTLNGGSIEAYSSQDSVGSPVNSSTLGAGVTISLASNSLIGHTGIDNSQVSPLTIAGTITGNFGITKIGGDTVTLSGRSNYTGSTIINGGYGFSTASGAGGGYDALNTLGGGTLAIGTTNALPTTTALIVTQGTFDLAGYSQTVGSISDGTNANGSTLLGTSYITSSAAVTTALPAPTLTVGGSATTTYSGIISGLGLSFAQSGTGNQTLAGLNTYGGSTAVNSGTLTVTNVATGSTAQSLGEGSNVTLGVAGTSSGLLVYTGGTGTLDKSISALGNGGDTIKNAGAGALTLTGTLTKNNTVLTLNGGNGGIVVNGQVTGGTNLNFNSDLDVVGGVTTLTNASNNYTGPTNIFGAGTLKEGVTNSVPIGSVVTLGNVSDGAVTNTLDLNGFGQTIAALNSTSNGGSTNSNIVTDSGASGTNTLTLTGINSDASAANGNFGGVIQNGANANTALVVSGGTQTLGGVNTYTGTTTVSGGNLVVTGRLASGSSVFVGNNASTVAILSGTGTVSGALNTSTTGGNIAYIAPGVNTSTVGAIARTDFGAVGTLHVGSLGFTVGNGTQFDFDLNTSTAIGGTTNDLVAMNGGTLNLGSGIVFNIDALSTLSGTGTYTLINGASSIVGFSPSDFSATVNGVSVSNATFSTSGGSLLLTFASAASPNYYFTGSNSGSFTDGGNYYTAASGGSQQAGLPSSTSNVFLNATSPTPANTPDTLNTAVSINSLNFVMAGTSLVGSGTVTLAATGTAGITDGGSTLGQTETVAPAVVLGSNQSWAATANSTLNVTGAISGPQSLAVTGNGTYKFAGSNTFQGLTVGTGSDTPTLYLTNGTSGSATGTTTLRVNAGATLAGNGTSSGTSFNISGTGTTTGARANVLVGLTSATDTTVGNQLALIGSTGTSTIADANLTFNLSATSTASNQLSVGATNIGFGTDGKGSVLFSLNLQGEPAIVPNGTLYTLIAGIGSTSTSPGSSTGQYTGLTLGTSTTVGGVTETIITGNNLQLAFGSSIDNTYYGNGSYLVLYQSAGVDDIDVVVVPEPGTWAMMLGGLALLVVVLRKKRVV